MYLKKLRTFPNGIVSHGRNDVYGAASAGKGRKLTWAAGFAGLITFAALATTYQLSSQTPNQNKPILLPEANRPPDANAQMTMRDQQAKKQNFEAANLERKRQITDDSARLLKLANDLKAEVDKTSKDTLSIGVIRKADEIERLAHNVKEKMKLTIGAN
jgi:hypothetical protein